MPFITSIFLAITDIENNFENQQRAKLRNIPIPISIARNMSI